MQLSQNLFPRRSTGVVVRLANLLTGWTTPKRLAENERHSVGPPRLPLKGFQPVNVRCGRHTEIVDQACATEHKCLSRRQRDLITGDPIGQPP